MTVRGIAIVGVGYSAVSKESGLSWQQLTSDAILAAMMDGGLERGDIDGMVSMGGNALGDAAALGIGPLNWSAQADFGPAFIQAATTAVAGIAAGFCETCVAVRVIQRGRHTPSSDWAGQMGVTSALMAPDAQYKTAYGAGGPWWAGLMARRHMSRFGSTELDFARHAVNKREFARLNEDALFRDPLSVDDYMRERYVCEPLRVLDCDYPVDAAAAVIFTTSERARDFQKAPVYIESAALVATHDTNMESVPEDHGSETATAARLWSRTDLSPRDVDCAQLYDGFSIIAMRWLEVLGFCEQGGGPSFAASADTRLGGRLPLNTDGGAGNVGRRHGANYCIEAVRQIRGECGTRQVPNADVAVWTNSIGFSSGAMLLTRYNA